MCKFCGCGAAKLTKETLAVGGMTCGHCKNAVEKAVRGLPGVLAAEVDLAAGKLSVEFDPAKTGLPAIKTAIVEEGYTV